MRSHHNEFERSHIQIDRYFREYISIIMYCYERQTNLCQNGMKNHNNCTKGSEVEDAKKVPDHEDGKIDALTKVNQLGVWYSREKLPYREISSV